jgi:hypothetical protein
MPLASWVLAASLIEDGGGLLPVSWGILCSGFRWIDEGDRPRDMERDWGS